MSKTKNLKKSQSVTRDKSQGPHQCDKKSQQKARKRGVKHSMAPTKIDGDNERPGAKGILGHWLPNLQIGKEIMSGDSLSNSRQCAGRRYLKGEMAANVSQLILHAYDTNSFIAYRSINAGDASFHSQRQDKGIHGKPIDDPSAEYE